MSDHRTTIRNRASEITAGNRFGGYTRVVVVVSDDVEYTAGDTTGRTMTVTSPWGSQAMANNLLRKIRGFQYQPFQASDAHLDPAAEIGDGINAGKTYSGIFEKTVSLGPMYTADVSAPGGEQLNYKYEYKSPTDRRVEREFRNTRASLRIQADRITQEVEERKKQGETFTSKLEVQSQLISAKVSKTGGDNSSFGWELTDTMWRLLANGSEVMKVTRDGLSVSGNINGKTGYIGGFDINQNYLSYNNQTWGGTNSSGVYIGQEGIQLGHKDRGVRISNYGDLYANNGYFRGSVDAGNIEYGGDSGYFSGSGISEHSLSGRRLEYNTVGTSYTSGGINASLANADWASNILSGYSNFESLAGREMRAASMYLDGNKLRKSSIYYTDGNGTAKTAYVIKWG